MRSNRRRRSRLFRRLRAAVGPDVCILSRRHADGALVHGRPPVKVLASMTPIAIEADKNGLPYWEGSARRRAYDHYRWGGQSATQGSWEVSW